MGIELRRPALRFLAAATLLASIASPASAQEALAPLQPLVDFLSAQVDIDLEASLASDPGGGAIVSERASDFEHITGEQPRFTPNYMDIRSGALYALEAGPALIFAPTNGSELWAPTGPREIDPPGHPPFFTYTSTLPQDGAQYEDGALLFELVVREPPPPQTGGICDYTIWVHDPTRAAPFRNLAEFPLDPAAGTNLAFGLRLTPEDGGVPTTFALALDEAGVFQQADIDVRAFVVGVTVGIIAPRGAVGEIAALNYYADCSTDASGIDPTTSGADQTGLVAASLAEAGSIVIRETPVTATPTLSTTTTARSAVTTSSEVADGEAPGVAVWAPAVAAAAVLGSIGFWLVARRRNPEARALAAWVKAERGLWRAESEAMPLLAACVDASAVVDELEHERVDLCRVWPPACLDDEAEAGEGLSSHDQHFRRMALGELWDDYREGKIGSEEVEARWRQVNTPEFQTRMRDSDEAYRETLSQIDSELTGARAAREATCGQAGAARSDVESARIEVATTRDSYGQLAEAAADPLPAVTSLLEPCPTGTGGWVVPDGPVELLRVNVGFMLTIGRFHGRDRNLERGERLVLEMEGLLHELDLTAEVDETRVGAAQASWSDHEYDAGAYWLTSRGVVRTGSDLLPPDGEAEPEMLRPRETAVLTRLPSSLGEHAYSRVSGWATGFETLSLQRTFFHQMMSARPYTVWGCDDGTWACRERVWRIEVGEAMRNRGAVRWFSAETQGRRAQFETEVNRLAWVATGVVTRDLRRLMRWRAKLSAGPCQ